MTKQSFVQGALVLFISGIIVKIIGFIFQIAVIRLIGTEPVGIYNMVFPVYMTVIVISTAGLPLAISKMVAQQIGLGNLGGALKIFKIALTILIILSIFFTATLLFISPLLLKSLYNDPRVLWCFYAMIPGIIIVPICSAFRGLFQGLQEMLVPAVTQCIEQIVRISTALFLIKLLKPYGIKMIAVGLSLSMILGEFIGLLLIYALYKLKRKKLRENIFSYEKARTISTTKIIKELFTFGFPTTLTRVTNSLVYTLEATLIPITLQKCGFNINQAASIYGQFSGVSMSLLTIPTVLTFSLATSLVPSISEAEAQGKFSVLQFRSSEALRLTYLFGLPVMVILLLKASSLSNILYNLPEAGITVRYLALGALFLYLAQTSNGILQGLGLVKTVFFNTIAGAIIKVAGHVFLVKISEKNRNGGALAFSLGFFVICILNLMAIYQKTGFQLKFKEIAFPFLSTIAMAFIIIFATRLLNNFLSGDLVSIISILSGFLIYMFLITASGQFSFKYLLLNKKQG